MKGHSARTGRIQSQGLTLEMALRGRIPRKDHFREVDSLLLHSMRRVAVGHLLRGGTTRLMEAGLVDTEAIVSHRFPLTEIHDAMAVMDSPERNKVMIHP